MHFSRTRRIHFVGIGGVGMSGIAEVLLTQGYSVSGSDIEESSRVRNLRRRGADITIGHSRENVIDADVVVRTSAVDDANCELSEARTRSIPVIPRAEMLAELMRLKRGVAIAGTHGKTTTTAMVSHVLQVAEYDPTVVVGGRMHNLGIGARVGGGDHIVVEADESDGSFLKLLPVVSAVTNIEDDHLDYFGSMEAVVEAFKKFINSVPFYGFTAICGDDPRLRELLPNITKPHRSYGLGDHNQLRAVNVCHNEGAQVFEVIRENERLGEMELPLPGKFNVQNSLAAVAVALELDVSFGQIREAFKSFQGVARRFDYKGRVEGLRLYDDYAHHPTEIKKTLAAARETFETELLVIFQPHRYSRTKQLADKFPAALEAADRLCVTDIYPAGEEPIPGVDLDFLREKFGSRGDDVYFASDREEILNWVQGVVAPDRSQVLFTLGAGDVVSLAEPIQDLVARESRVRFNEDVGN